jgi:hypothetical protein
MSGQARSERCCGDRAGDRADAWHLLQLGGDSELTVLRREVCDLQVDRLFLHLESGDDWRQGLSRVRQFTHL